MLSRTMGSPPIKKAAPGGSATERVDPGAAPARTERSAATVVAKMKPGAIGGAGGSGGTGGADGGADGEVAVAEAMAMERERMHIQGSASGHVGVAANRTL